MLKNYQIKIYQLDGTYLKTIEPSQIMTEVRFQSRIGGGQGQLTLDLNLPIDDFGEGGTIDYMNIVKVYEIDDVNHQSPVLIYTGFISQYIPFFSGSTEGIKIVCLGLVSLLSYAYYKNGSNYSVTASGIDAAQIMRNIITHFNTIYSGSWIGTDANCVDVGQLVSYEFTDKKWLDALKETFDLAGGGRYWTIRENGKLYFKQKPSTPTHKLTLGLNVESGEINKNTEKVVNLLQLRYNSPTTTADYQDATSQTNYGRREKIHSDSKITDLTTANQRGNGEIADAKDPKIEAKIRVNNTYDIESIHPGDTCTIKNKKKGATVFDDNMLITSVTYGPEGVDIELENDRPTFADIFDREVQRVAGN